MLLHASSLARDQPAPWRNLQTNATWNMQMNHPISHKKIKIEGFLPRAMLSTLYFASHVYVCSHVAGLFWQYMSVNNHKYTTWLNYLELQNSFNNSDYFTNLQKPRFQKTFLQSPFNSKNPSPGSTFAKSTIHGLRWGDDMVIWPDH